MLGFGYVYCKPNILTSCTTVSILIIPLMARTPCIRSEFVGFLFGILTGHNQYAVFIGFCRRLLELQAFSLVHCFNPFVLSFE